MKLIKFYEWLLRVLEKWSTAIHSRKNERVEDMIAILNDIRESSAYKIKALKEHLD